MSYSSFPGSYQDKGLPISSACSSSVAANVSLTTAVLTKIPLMSGDTSNFNWTVNYSDGSWVCPETGLWGIRVVTGMADDGGIAAQRKIVYYVNGMSRYTVSDAYTRRLGDYSNGSLAPLFLEAGDSFEVYLSQYTGSTKTMASGELSIACWRLL